VDQAHGYQLTVYRIVKWSWPLNRWWRAQIFWKRKGTLLLISTVHQRLDSGGRRCWVSTAAPWSSVVAHRSGFGRFRAQIKAGVEGSSPRGIPGNGSYQKMACSGKDSALALNNGRRELQWSVSTGSSPNVCSTASASSSGSRCGPKHRQDAALCVGATTRV
jgi:hypothetical protein